MKTLANLINSVAQPLSGARTDYDPLLDLAGDARVVLLGTQTHGTHEFYRERANITKRLIAEKGFNAVAVEADWPDAYRVNGFVRGESADTDATEALGGFTAFPTWLWRNVEVVDFVGWLRAYNDALLKPGEKAGFYGLDLYSLHKSIDAVVAYLERVDPTAAKEARIRYACFDHFGEEVRRYGFAARLGLAKSCQDEAVKELVELRHRRAQLLQRNDAGEELFAAGQNALLVENAERYYRTMFSERTTAWNQREGHMMETLLALEQHLQRPGRPARIVVWVHNLHAGDAQATELGKVGRVSLGQLARQHWSGDAVLIGLTTDSGTIIAASDWWDSAPVRVSLKPAVQESYEAVFHQTDHRRFMLNLREENKATASLRSPRLERTVGVVYRPGSERRNHYFAEACLTNQFDAVIHIDETLAVEPIERTTEWDKGEVPETFPMGV